MNVDQVFQRQNNEVLIVDDSASNLEFLNEILINDGYSVRQSSSGAMALKALKAKLPVIILLDVMMPEMDGFEVCRRLKSDPKTCDIPVIFISALDSEQSKLQGFQVGGIDYITKPFRREEVLARVRTQVRLGQMRSQLEQQSIDLQNANKKLTIEIARRKLAEEAMGKRIVALTKPFADEAVIDFDTLFNLSEIQKLQDQFASAFGVASIITRSDGTSITSPSNFSRLCQNIIRCTDKGLKNCMHSDSVIGRHNPEGPIVQPCLSGGLWDAGASITVGGKHVANWLIGQVRNEVQNEGKLEEYAREIGADETDFMQAFSEITSMSQEQFHKIAEMLFTMAGQLSEMAFQNAQQARFINERKLAEEALSESEELFRTTLYSIGDGVITTDANGCVRLMNPVAEQLTGWTQAQASGQMLEEVFPIISEETREQVEIPVRKVLREGVIVGLANHTLLIAKDGTERPIADSGAPIRNKNGETVGVVLVFRDQTVERRAEQALNETEKRFRLLYENAPLSYQSLDSQARLIDVNPVWLRTMGYSGKDEVVGHHFGEFMTTKSAELIKNRFADFVTAGEIHNYEFDMVRKDGTIITVSYEGKIGYDELGHFKQTHCIFTDITEQKKAELALKESEERFRNIVESSPIGKYFYHLEEDGNLIFTGANPSANRIIGIDHQTLIGKTIQVAFPNLAQTQFPEMYAQIAKGEIGTQFFEIEYFENQINGFFQVTVFRIGNNSITVDFIDISERKKAELALKESEERFRKAITEAPFPIMIHADNDEIIAISRGWTEMSGYEKSDIPTTREWTKQAYGNEQGTVKSYIDSLYGLDHWVDEGEYEIHAKCGEKRIWDFSSSPLGKLADERRLVISMAKDVTARKKTEDALFAAEKMMDAFFDQSLDGFYFMMLDKPVEWNEEADKIQLLEYVFSHQRITKINDAMLLQYGADRNQFLGITPNDMFAHNIEDGKAILRNLFDEGNLHCETEERNLTGESIFIEGDYSCFYDAKGRITGHFGIQRDITDSKKMAEILWESERKYRYLFENNPVPMWIYDLETLRFLEVNGAAVNHYGYSRQDFLNMTLKDIRPKEEFDRLIQDVESTSQILNRAGVWKHIKKDGEIIYVDIVSHYVDFEGKPSRIVISTDITDRIYTQMEIETEKQLLRTLIDNLPDPIYVKDHDGRKMLANRADLENIGVLTESEVLGKSDLELFNSEIGYRGYEDDLIVIESGEPIINREEVFFNENGVKRYLLTSKIPLFDENGKTTGLVGIGKDITEQKRSNETIQKLTKSIEQSPSTIVITDIHGVIEYVNPKFMEITGYTPEEVIGQNPRILKSGEMPPEKYKELWDIISSGGVWRGEFHNRRKNGELYWEWATMTSIKDESGVIINYIAIKEDISIRKQMEADLIVAKNKAEESDRLKSAFLANMSHEIRTPLNSIIGFSELLSDSDFEIEEKKEFIQHIITNGNSLLNIISDIMDISRMESGQVTIRKSQISVNKFIEGISEQFAIKFEDSNVEFKLEIPDSEKEIFILADGDRLRQIFNNLISNALKFTSRGFIQIGYQVKGKMVEFSVADTGIGIPADYHDIIFDRFRQVESFNSRKYGGNGLGLAITKNLVELMGGNIWLDSESGKGSSFYFVLPLFTVD